MVRRNEDGIVTWEVRNSQYGSFGKLKEDNKLQDIGRDERIV